jgi:HD-GYP domain-containing protein (c-di-GMP phosphodiesterase class II)
MAIEGVAGADRHRSRRHIVRALLYALARRDRRLYQHGVRTADYAAALGAAIGLSTLERLDLHFAALLHDIGQLTLPDHIFQRDHLTGEEYEFAQCHPRAGAELLQDFPFLRKPAVLIAHHHERWDGMGYPYGLRGRLIPLGSRILAVADAFDALAIQMSRCDRRRIEEGINRLRIKSGSQLDPHLTEIFIRLHASEMHSETLPGRSCLRPAGMGVAVPPGARPTSGNRTP